MPGVNPGRCGACPVHSTWKRSTESASPPGAEPLAPLLPPLPPAQGRLPSRANADIKGDLMPLEDASVRRGGGRARTFVSVLGGLEARGQRGKKDCSSAGWRAFGQERPNAQRPHRRP
jgi:hypothetical protein